ncbi:MAG TPA: hypothetical protein VMW17_05695 [Candidatus Binatia bacterium]|nr:hypothetical protein [Candidatus Binatia bacterium]
MTAFAGWENFYVIVGSSAGALIGLQCVVITLIADMPIARGDAQASAAFATPSVVHFGVVLLLSGIVSAPCSGIAVVAPLWGVAALGGLAYVLIVARRLRMQTLYKPGFEDWLFMFCFPLGRTQPLPDRHARRGCLRAQLCFSLAVRCCFCCSSAFTMRGMPLPTTSL